MPTLLIACLLSLPVWQAELSSESTAPAPAIAWHSGTYNAALREARSESRPVLVAFLPEWSDYSRQMREDVLAAPAVASVLADMLCLDVDTDTPQGEQVIRLHEVTSFPVLVVTGPDGRTEDRIDGFIPANLLVGELRRILSGTNTVSDFRARSAAAPDDLSLRASLSAKLKAVGQGREADRLTASIRRDDPEGATLTGARVLMQDAIDDLVAAANGQGASAYDPQVLAALLPGLVNERARFEGWTRVADLARLSGREGEVLPAYRSAWGVIPEEFVLVWGLDLVDLLREGSEGFDSDAMDFYLEVAQAVADGAEGLENAVAAIQAAGLPPDTTAEQFLAERLDALAFAHWARGETAEAVALAERCVLLDPVNLEYRERPAFFLAER